VTSEVVGRQEELGLAKDLLDSLARAPGALVLEGQAGIGKTRLWLDTVNRAEARGFTVIRTRPTSADARLVFGGLGDLLRAHAERFAALPSPQARALAQALSLEPAEGPIDAAALAAAVLNVLASAAGAAPVLIAVDDAQWLDPETERLLAFALRRVTSEPVGLLATVRRGAGVQEPRELLFALPEERVVRRSVGPLTVAAVHEIVRAEIGSVSRPTLLRLHEASGGNPLYALELARALQTLGHEPRAGEPLHVPSTLERLMENRLGAVPEDTRETLLAVALLAQPTARVLAKALGDPQRVDRDLDVSETAGLLHVDRDGIRFSHPLLASVLVASATERGRRLAHRKLVDAVESAEERVLHLALATDPPNAGVAAELDGTAVAARARAAPAAAAELAEHALVLTPVSDTARLFERRLAAGRFYQEAGSTAQAHELAAAAAACAETSGERAAAMLQLARSTGPKSDRLAVLREAAGETRVDGGLRAEILAELAAHLDAATQGEAVIEEAEAVRAEAVALAEHDSNEERRVRVLCLVAWDRTFFSGAVDRNLLDRALELAQGSSTRVSFAATTYGALLAMAYDLERARELLTSVRVLGPGVDDERLAEALGQLGRVEWAAGNWEHAAELTEESARLFEQLGSETFELEQVAMQAVIAASRGDIDATREFARRVIRLQALTEQAGAHVHTHGLALLELSLDHFEAAYELVRPGLERKAIRRLRFPLMTTPIAIEALTQMDRKVEAFAYLEDLEEDARCSGHAWALASAQHCRGALAAFAGELEAAETLLATAAERFHELGLPFEYGRSLLAVGTVRRRLQRKLVARETLEEARLVLDRLGARIWVARAESELRRIGGRRTPAGSALSEMETQIAALVSGGQTNTEVALALQISRKTVEWNLSKIYRKLGVRSRTELAARTSE
jgi:DNA-binding CsgD family transcriptional regulator/tetratricopeptide (TPR) repeat protein